jgi:hypothetical protein
MIKTVKPNYFKMDKITAAFSFVIAISAVNLFSNGATVCFWLHKDSYNTTADENTTFYVSISIFSQCFNILHSPATGKEHDLIYSLLVVRA